jgi:CheY-like chemotaxis protein
VETALKGLNVFVVEDEFAVLLMLEDMLAELGCNLAGTASRMAEALKLVGETSPSVAVLDVNVAGEPVYPLAEVLARRQVPIVFSTGYGGGGMDPQWRGRPILQKPYRIDDLQKALLAAIGGKPA